MMISSPINVVVSQRLVRRLCDKCKKPAILSEEKANQFSRKGIDPSCVMSAAGCKTCSNSGYYGRTGLFDVNVINEEFKSMIMDKNFSLGELKQKGAVKGANILKKQGIMKVIQGVTTLEEVKRVVSNLT